MCNVKGIERCSYALRGARVWNQDPGLGFGRGRVRLRLFARRALAATDDIALTTTLVTDSCDRLLLYTLDTDDDMIHDDTITNDDGQGLRDA